MKNPNVQEELQKHKVELVCYILQLRALTFALNDVRNPDRMCKAINEALDLLTKRREAMIRIFKFARENGIPEESVDLYSSYH